MAARSGPRTLGGTLRESDSPGRLFLSQRARAAFLAPGITVTVLAAAFSILFPLLFPLLPSGSVPYHLVLLLGAAALAALVVLLVLSGALALWAADPQAYASMLLAGRPPTEVLVVISRHIMRSCERTLALVDGGKGLFEALEKRLIDQPEKLTEGERGQIADFRSQIRRLMQEQHAPLLRIEAMKLLASREMDVPPRRLCDHVFQYSPTMHRDRLQKYLGLWGELLNLQQLQSARDPRFKALLDQSKSFLNNTRRRIRYQTQILENRDLHPYIVQFASTHSTSGSLQTYAEALRFVAATSPRAGAPGKDIVEPPIANRFRFLHRKQRAHPGFDLHTLLRRAVRAKTGGTAAQDALLKALAEEDQTTAGDSARLRESLTDDALAQLLSLPANLTSLIAKSRKDIAAGFASVARAWFENVTGTRYIVCHGYSRTVLAMLKNPPDGWPAAPQSPRLFFILAEEEDSFDTRVMEYELKESSNMRGLWSFAAGAEGHLLGLVAPGDAVLVLLGAECFDGERRVVHARGIVRRLERLVRRLRNRGVKSLVAAVAETYKLHDTSLTQDTKFYSQHFDRIALYQPQAINLVVTDQKTLPEDWRTVVERWNQVRLPGAGTA